MSGGFTPSGSGMSCASSVIATTQRKRASQPQELAERMHELGNLRAVKREAVRARNAAAAPAKESVEHSLLLGIGIALG